MPEMMSGEPAQRADSVCEHCGADLPFELTLSTGFAADNPWGGLWFYCSEECRDRGIHGLGGPSNAWKLTQSDGRDANA